MKQTVGIPRVKETPRQRENRTIFEALTASGERLMRIIRKYKQGTNKDIKDFTDDVNALCDKWNF